MKFTLATADFTKEYKINCDAIRIVQFVTFQGTC